MHQRNLNIAVATALFGVISARIRRVPLSRPMLALNLGVLTGPAALGLVRPANWPHGHEILRGITRFTLAVAVVGAALRTPRETPARSFGRSRCS
jgi:NhaP-type Na+/H+ or K+/H+ antiporter